MLRSRSICLLCHSQTLRTTAPFPPARHARTLTSSRRRVPARMALSPRVSQSPRPPSSSPGSKPTLKRHPLSPFGGMNQTQARIAGTPERRSASQERRSTGGKPARKDDDKRRDTDFHALKMQPALSAFSYSYRSAVRTKIASIDSFDSFPLLSSVKAAVPEQALKGLELIKPTPVQRLVIPAMLSGEPGKGQKAGEMQQILIAAETGSGKTLAYLLPLIDAVKRAEAVDEEVLAYQRALAEEKEKLAKHPQLQQLDAPSIADQPHPTTGRPRAIILLPTSELVTQVGTLLKALSYTAKFRTALISSAYSGRVIRNRLFSPSGIDILVSTPHLLSSIAESDPNILSRTTHLVIDEADSLLDRSFSPLTSAIIDRATPSLRSLVLCSATIPRSLDAFLRTRFPHMRRLVTPNLHAIPRRVQLGVVEIDKAPYHGNRDLACAETIWGIGKSAEEHATRFGEVVRDRVMVKRILVFVNERESAQRVADYLVARGIEAVALSRDTPEQRQAEILGEFTTATIVSAAVVPAGRKINYSPAHMEAAPKRKLPNTKVLVTTDLGSRGIDTVAVRHVVLYDVPHSTIDFIHRLGRTGRMGRRGRGVVLVGKGDRRDVVKEVRDGMYMGQALI
ncbi:MAG: RNA helicase [Trizodia sp. TS-e1964]|nr:MAG: RNA helicase [Trizodia sp. TS-e1964]